MKVDDVIQCKDKDTLKRQMVRLLKEGYVIKVEFDKNRITINDVPQDAKEAEDD